MKSLSLKRQLTLAFSFVTLLVIAALGMVLWKSMSSELLKRTETSIRFDIEENDKALDSFYTVYMSKTDSVFLDTELAPLLKKQKLNLVEIIATRDSILDRIERQVAFDLKYPEVRSSYYFGGSTLFKLYVKNNMLVNHQEIQPFDVLRDQRWYDDLLQNQRMFSWNADETMNGTSYVAFNRRLLDLKSYEDVAALKVMIPYTKIKNVIEQNLSRYAEAYIYSDEDYNTIIAGNLLQKTFSNTNLDDIISHSVSSVCQYKHNGKTYLVSSTVSELTGWHLTYIVPWDLVTEGLDIIKPIIVIACVLSVMLCFIAASMISSGIAKRINVLIYKTKQVSIGHLDFDQTPADMGKDEISQLDRTINMMSQEIKKLQFQELRFKDLINEVRAELLQEQINPHLLYNTLSMIKLMSKNEGQSEVYYLTDQLVVFYKSVLNRGSLIVPVKQELEMIRSYVQVAQVVYDIEIRLTTDISEEVQSLYTVKLLLQPLVENAVLHGLRPIRGGQIIVRAQRNADSIRFSVLDTGIGIEQTILDSIRATIQNEEFENECYSGYGIYNICRRLKLFFGTNGQIEIQSQEGEGTEVIFTIPSFTKEAIIEWMKNRSIPNM